MYPHYNDNMVIKKGQSYLGWEILDSLKAYILTFFLSLDKTGSEVFSENSIYFLRKTLLVAIKCCLIFPVKALEDAFVQSDLVLQWWVACDLLWPSPREEGLWALRCSVLPWPSSEPQLGAFWKDSQPHEPRKCPLLMSSTSLMLLLSSFQPDGVGECGTSFCFWRPVFGSQERWWVSLPPFCSFFFTVLEFELRALHLLNRHSATYIMPPAFFALLIFQIGSPVYA
jgi:hypothetical protein